jgi:hydrogenase maturation protease
MTNESNTATNGFKQSLVLCLGNEILSDDGFGPAVAGRLLECDGLTVDTEIISASLAGFNLLDHLAGRERVLIVDTIRTKGSVPGDLHYFPLNDLAPSHHLTTSHQISLPTAIELGRSLGMNMPGEIDVLAVEASDLETLQEKLTPAVSEAVSTAVKLVKEWVLSKW